MKWTHLVAGRNPRVTLWRMLALGGLTVVGVLFVARPGRASGISMEPTYRDGKFYVINRLAYRFGSPRRGDVVAVPMTGSWRYFKLKRILGMPGEELAFRRGRLLIDGSPFTEPWVEFTGDWTLPAITLGPDEYFVAGDNRHIPFARNWHSKVRGDQLHGKVFP